MKIASSGERGIEKKNGVFTLHSRDYNLFGY